MCYGYRPGHLQSFDLRPGTEMSDVSKPSLQVNLHKEDMSVHKTSDIKDRESIHVNEINLCRLPESR